MLERQVHVEQETALSQTGAMIILMKTRGLSTWDDVH